MPYEFVVEGGVEHVVTPNGPKRVFETPLPQGRSVALREYAPQEFMSLSKVIALDGPKAGWEMVMRALETSIVRVDGKDVEYVDLVHSLREVFSMRELLIVRTVWERIHMPDPLFIQWLDTMRPEKWSNGLVFRAEVSEERIVEFREISVPVFERVLELSDPNDVMGMSVTGLAHSLVSDRGQVFDEQPVPVERILQVFSLREILSLRAAWEAVHMPNQEDLDRVKDVGV